MLYSILLIVVIVLYNNMIVTHVNLTRLSLWCDLDTGIFMRQDIYGTLQ